MATTDKFLENKKIQLWIAGSTIFAIWGYFGSMLNIVSWPIAILMGYVNGFVLHRSPTGWRLTAHGWPLLLTMIASGFMLGGLPYWLMIAVNMNRPLYILGDVITAILYIAGIGIYVCAVKIKFLWILHRP